MVMVSASACIVSSLILRNIIILTGQLCIYKVALKHFWSTSCDVTGV